MTASNCLSPSVYLFNVPKRRHCDSVWHADKRDFQAKLPGSDIASHFDHVRRVRRPDHADGESGTSGRDDPSNNCRDGRATSCRAYLDERASHSSPDSDDAIRRLSNRSTKYANYPTHYCGGRAFARGGARARGR